MTTLSHNKFSKFLIQTKELICNGASLVIQYSCPKFLIQTKELICNGASLVIQYSCPSANTAYK